MPPRPLSTPFQPPHPCACPSRSIATTARLHSARAAAAAAAPCRRHASPLLRCACRCFIAQRRATRLTSDRTHNSFHQRQIQQSLHRYGDAPQCQLCNRTLHTTSTDPKARPRPIPPPAVLRQLLKRDVPSALGGCLCSTCAVQVSADRLPPLKRARLREEVAIAATSHSADAAGPQSADIDTDTEERSRDDATPPAAASPLCPTAAWWHNNASMKAQQGDTAAAAAVREVVRSGGVAVLDAVAEACWRVTEMDRRQYAAEMDDEQATGTLLFPVDQPVTLEQWRQVLSPSAVVPVVEWSMEHERECAARGDVAVYLSYPQYPAAVWDARKSAWQWATELTGKHASEEGIDLGTYECDPRRGDREQRWGNQPRPNRKRKRWTLPAVADTLKFKQARHEYWKTEVYGSDIRPNKLPDKITEATRRTFAALDCYTFIAAGPSGNNVHADPVGGLSQLAHGWKLFIVFHLRDYWPHIVQGMGLSGMSVEGLTSGRARSLRWVLLGPGATIVLPPQYAHFVITLCDSVLVTWCRTAFVHNQLLSLLYHMVGRTPEPSWDDFDGDDYVLLWQYLCRVGRLLVRKAMKTATEPDKYTNSTVEWLVRCWTARRAMLHTCLLELTHSETRTPYGHGRARLTQTQVDTILLKFKELDMDLLWAEAESQGGLVCD